jgi:hypothetical protein
MQIEAKAWFVLLHKSQRANLGALRRANERIHMIGYFFSIVCLNF